MSVTRVRPKQIFGAPSTYETVVNALNPLSITPNNTVQIEVDGSFFTPDMVVSVSGTNTVDEFIFISQVKIILTITSGSEEGSFDISMDNSIAKTHIGVLVVSTGSAYSLTTTDWSVPAKVEDKSDGKQWMYANAWSENKLLVDIPGDFQFYFRRYPFGGATNTTFQIRLYNSVDDTQIGVSGINSACGEGYSLLKRNGSIVQLFEDGELIYNLPTTSASLNIAFVNYAKGLKDIRLFI